MTTSSQARIAAYESWARTLDRAARTAPAVRGLAEKFTREARERLGPDATEKQVADAADAARKAHYTRLSAAGHAAKQARRAAGGCLAQLPVGRPRPWPPTALQDRSIVILQCCQPTGIIAETPGLFGCRQRGISVHHHRWVRHLQGERHPPLARASSAAASGASASRASRGTRVPQRGIDQPDRGTVVQHGEVDKPCVQAGSRLGVR